MSCRTDMHITQNLADDRDVQFRGSSHLILSGIRTIPEEFMTECSGSNFEELLMQVINYNPTPTGVRAYFAKYPASSGVGIPPSKENGLTVIFRPTENVGKSHTPIANAYFLVNELGIFSSIASVGTYISSTELQKWIDFYAINIQPILTRIVGIPEGDTLNLLYLMDKIQNFYDYIQCLANPIQHHPPEILQAVQMRFASYKLRERVTDLDGISKLVEKQLAITYKLKTTTAHRVAPITIYGFSNNDTAYPCPPNTNCPKQ